MDETTDIFETTEFETDPTGEDENAELSTTAALAVGALLGAAATATVCWVKRNRASLAEKIAARKAAKNVEVETEATEPKSD